MVIVLYSLRPVIARELYISIWFRVSNLSRKFRSANGNFLSKLLGNLCKILAKFVSDFRKIRHNFWPLLQNFFFRKKKTIFLWNGKILIFIEWKLNENFTKMKFFCENEIEKFGKNTSKFVKILNEIERISFLQFREFNSTKIWMETHSSY